MSALSSPRRHLVAVFAIALGACNAILGNNEAVDVDVDRDIDGTEPEGDTAVPAARGTDAAARDARSDARSDAGTCARGTKACSARCVSESEPIFGCASDDCKPCALPHAVAACAGGACAIASCALGWADCNGVASDGCEADLTAPTTCGACTNRCAAAKNGANRCVGGFCVLTCTAGYGDCDGRPENGCEASLKKDKKNCGACGVGCIVGRCSTGQCTFGGDDDD